MERYSNFGGDSGVVGYESGDDYIRVQFSDGSVYLYTYNATGEAWVEHMKQLADNGQGLNEFINRTVKKSFERKER